jgi:hypothetical protein
MTTNTTYSTDIEEAAERFYAVVDGLRSEEGLDFPVPSAPDYQAFTAKVSHLAAELSAVTATLAAHLPRE